MAKAGRKGWFERSEAEKQKLYSQYINRYNNYSSKYDMSAQLSYKAFKQEYQAYYVESKQNVIRRMVSDSVNVTHKQAKAWAQLAVNKGVMQNYRQAYDSFRRNDALASYYWKLVSKYGFREFNYTDAGDDEVN